MSSISFSLIPLLIVRSLVNLEGEIPFRLTTMVVTRGRWSKRDTSLSVETETLLAWL